VAGARPADNEMSKHTMTDEMGGMKGPTLPGGSGGGTPVDGGLWRLGPHGTGPTPCDAVAIAGDGSIVVAGLVGSSDGVFDGCGDHGGFPTPQRGRIT
jgi:hypothetical protein